MADTPLNVKEENSATLTFVVKDGSGVAIPVARISTATIDIVTDKGVSIVSARDISSDIDSNGLATINLSSSDNVIKGGNSVLTEKHRVVVKIVTSDATPITIKDEIPITVTSIQTV